MSKEIIAIIPARSGSKGIKNKNILKIKSKTLIEIAVYQAKKISKLDKIIISSDSDYYTNIAKYAGASSLGLRPKHLSKDNTKTIDVLKEITNLLPSIETILLLQPTSPIRSIVDIEKALSLCIKTKKCVISVAELDEPNPYKLQTLDKQKILRPFLKNSKYNSETPRQLLPKTYRLTGGFYCINVKNMLKYDNIIPPGSIGFPTEMFPNIDCQNDFEYINWLIETKKDLPDDFLDIINYSN